MPKRGQGFSNDEIEHLLDQIEDVIPIGSMAWDRVLVLHQTKYGNRQRTVQSLQRKFASLYNHKMPTGDPRCPETIRKAKQLYKAISEKMDVATGEPEGDEDEEDNDEDFFGSSGRGEDDEGIDEGDGEGEGYESGLAEPVPEGQNMNIDGGGAITSGNGDGNDVRICDGNEGNNRIPGNNTDVLDNNAKVINAKCVNLILSFLLDDFVDSINYFALSCCC
jgi:hypothetical protein